MPHARPITAGAGIWDTPTVTQRQNRSEFPTKRDPVSTPCFWISAQRDVLNKAAQVVRRFGSRVRLVQGAGKVTDLVGAGRKKTRMTRHRHRHRLRLAQTGKLRPETSSP
ncbi:hypothetical protein N0B44_34125, partial [Roseibacterium beibuensis]|uniref:hypothetical protein n=1 Tax=[Roseibacterium] beibuensis TaxID=1193142 RepID=UPI00217DB8BD